MPSRTPFAVPFNLLAAAITVGAREPVPSTATEDVERVAFAPSLAVDLARCERLASGVYRRDLQVGAGDSVRTAATLTLRRPCDGPTAAS